MFRNYFKTAIRNLLRNKGYTIINVTGLSLGIAVCLTIFIVIRFESSFDDFHEKKDRIYRVLTNYHGARYAVAGVSQASGVPAPLPTAIKNDFPQFESSAGIFLSNNVQVLVSDKNRQKFKSDVFFTEPSFFDMFDFTWLAGSPAVLDDPGAAVLSKETAEKYFGKWEHAPGQTLRLDNRYLLKVAGVIERVPVNTDFQFRIIAPYRLLDFAKSLDWYSINSARQCYVLVPPHSSRSSISSFNSQLEAFSRKYRHPSDSNTQMLQPLSEVHHHSEAKNFIGKTVTREHIRTLELIGAFILLIACVNFINLSTAQAVNRAKEVGVRKVLGSRRSQLTIQFLLETLLLVMLSVALAVLIVVLTLPVVGRVLDIPLSAYMLYTSSLFLFLLGIILVVTLLAGFYPSLVLSGFNPIAVLKSSFLARRAKGISLRRGLVVFQFIIAQVLIIATLVILKQMRYFENRSMGFEKEALINVPFPGDSVGIAKIGYLRDQLSALKGVRQVSFSNTAPADDDKWWTDFRFDGASTPTDFSVAYKWIDANYLDTYKLSLVAGRNVTRTDSVREFLVNETLVKKLGFARPEDVLNKEMDIWGGYVKGPIVGVLKDFHSFSLKDGIAPLFMANVKGAYQVAGIKLISPDMPETIASIGKIWNDLFPDYVFEYQFLDDKIDSFYRQERQLSQVYQIFAMVAILLSCLGLFGLASFMAVQRKKEVGIRKVLGATGSAIVYLLSKEFVLLTGIAFVIASSVAWYFMHRWLENYAYHTSMGWWVFIAGGGASVVIALITVSFHAVKAAITNPVKSLKSE